MAQERLQVMLADSALRSAVKKGRSPASTLPSARNCSEATEDELEVRVVADTAKVWLFADTFQVAVPALKGHF